LSSLTDDEVAAIAKGQLADAFAVLGPHDGWVRAFVRHAETLEVLDESGVVLATLTERRPWVFEGPVPLSPGQPYLLRATNRGGRWVFDDPYRFGPVLGTLDDHLLIEGAHRRLFDRLGAHPITHEGVEGVSFAVWAPNAARVAVVGDFNDWDGRALPMRKRVDSGIWEVFAPGLTPGSAYKYSITASTGERLPLKADPFGQASELRPATASVVPAPMDHAWRDAAYRAARPAEPWRAAMSAYEVHLGSWRRGPEGRFLTWDEIADALIPYAKDLGFTHLEFMPVFEHPLDESWGYQPIGLFAPTARFGEPAGLARLVDAAHAAGLGVILDWVPAHFPADAHGLARFDGGTLYEHPDPRRGFQPQWNTAAYDFARGEVANYLIANALYWLEVFHADGLRVDAVSAMLYLDYGREGGDFPRNAQGGREDRDAEAFLKNLNTAVYAEQPKALMIAEEATSWPGVTAPAPEGLGFGFKWNMGWMNDTLAYLELDPLFRQHHHDKLTFGLMFAFSENYVLPLSHDEVVHGKGTILSRMPGDDWRRFAGVRGLYGFQWGYPGKKLLFMGQEFGQRREWSEAGELQWELLQYPEHQGLQRLVRDLNAIYRATPALYARDNDVDAFRWSVVDDAAQSTAAWIRYGEDGDPPVCVICNFTPEPREAYRLGLPQDGTWTEIFNSDAEIYGGSGLGNLGEVVATDQPFAGFPASSEILLPPLATVFLRWDGARTPA
jgi:1,4-alpha-glucan branching enzyme